MGRRFASMVISAALVLSAADPLAGQPLARSGDDSSRQPPAQAFEDCRGRKAGDQITHQTGQGPVAATCEDSPQGLVARPNRNRTGQDSRPPTQDSRQAGNRNQPGGQRYSLEQALSDQAQLNTMAFNGLAFLTGTFGLDTFLPPGKVSDFFGFQYMRDIDAAGAGHNTSFLTRIAHNVLSILDAGQRQRLMELAKAQEADIRRSRRDAPAAHPGLPPQPGGAAPGRNPGVEPGGGHAPLGRALRTGRHTGLRAGRGHGRDHPFAFPGAEGRPGPAQIRGLPGPGPTPPAPWTSGP